MTFASTILKKKTQEVEQRKNLKKKTMKYLENDHDRDLSGEKKALLFHVIIKNTVKENVKIQNLFIIACKKRYH